MRKDENEGDNNRIQDIERDERIVIRNKKKKKDNILESHFSVGSLDFLIRCIGRNAENLVRISSLLLGDIDLLLRFRRRESRSWHFLLGWEREQVVDR